MTREPPCPHLSPAEHQHIAEEIDRACDFTLPRHEIAVAIVISLISLGISLWAMVGSRLTP